MGVVSQQGFPLQAGKRWVVERTNSWHNRGFRKLAICPVGAGGLGLAVVAEQGGLGLAVVAEQGGGVAAGRGGGQEVGAVLVQAAAHRGQRRRRRA